MSIDANVFGDGGVASQWGPIDRGKKILHHHLVFLKRPAIELGGSNRSHGVIPWVDESFLKFCSSDREELGESSFAFAIVSVSIP